MGLLGARTLVGACLAHAHKTGRPVPPDLRDRGPLFDGEVPLLEAFWAQVPGLLPEGIRTLLAKYGLVAGDVMRPASCCRRASGPGRPWRCSRPGA